MSKKTVPTNRNAYIITGPTSGIGRATALELAKHGTVVLVGRDLGRLDEVRKVIESDPYYKDGVVRACYSKGYLSSYKRL